MIEETHSLGRATRDKAKQFKEIISADMNRHVRDRYPDDSYLGIDLYAGRYTWHDGKGPDFYGSTGHFCNEADTHNLDWRYVGYEANVDRAISLENGTAQYGDRVIIRNELNEEAEYDLKPFQIFEDGIIMVDADGMFDFPLLMKVHKMFPDYSLMINFNAASIKRPRAKLYTGSIERLTYDHMLKLIAALPRWHRYITAPKAKEHWTILYFTKREKLF